MLAGTKENVSHNKFHSRIAFGEGTIRRIRFIEGVRTLMALIVIFHHIDLVNPRINKVSNMIWTVHKPNVGAHIFQHVQDNDNVFTADTHRKNIDRVDHREVITDHRRHLLSHKGRPSHSSLTILGTILSVFDITLFCLITGYVISLVAFRCYNYDFELDHHPLHVRKQMLCTKNYPFWLYKMIRLIIRRSLKMFFGLFWVQLITFILFHFDCITLRGAEVWRAREYYYDDFWSIHCHFGALFWSEINGALWVCDIFFWSTFACFIVIAITINVTDIKYRLFIYCVCCVLFHNDYYLPILMGIVAADIDFHGLYHVFFTKRKGIHNLLALSVFLLFVKLPIIGIFPGQYLVFKSIGWFNLGLYCCQYPNFWLTRSFAHRYICYWGRYTFALYIWHMIIYRFIGTMITPLFLVTKGKIEQLIWVDYTIVVCAVVIACCFAIVFHEVFEKAWNEHVVKLVLDKFQSIQNETDKKS
eukprot:121521_1